MDIFEHVSYLCLMLDKNCPILLLCFFNFTPIENTRDMSYSDISTKNTDEKIVTTFNPAYYQAHISTYFINRSSVSKIGNVSYLSFCCFIFPLCFPI